MSIDCTAVSQDALPMLRGSAHALVGCEQAAGWKSSNAAVSFTLACKKQVRQSQGNGLHACSAGVPHSSK